MYNTWCIIQSVPMDIMINVVMAVRFTFPNRKDRPNSNCSAG